MESLQFKKYQEDQKTIQMMNLHDVIKKMADQFFRISKENDVGVFFALCHVVISNASSKLEENKDLESAYKKAFHCWRKFNKSHEAFVSDIMEFFTSYSAREVITTLSTYYQGSMAKNERSNLGAFYTPISYCTEALSKVSKKENLKSLYDPFCGGAAWLCSFLLSRQPSLFDLDSIPVYGTDIDENAVILARLNLATILPKTDSIFLLLQKQIRVINSLYPNSDELKIMNNFVNACSMIATNPPYGFPVERKNKYFSTTLDKIPDKEVFYFAIEKMRKILPKEKPALYLVPNTFLFNLGSKDFKKFLSSNYNISVWDHTENDIFQTATVRTALLLLKEFKSAKSSISYSRCFSKKLGKLSCYDFIEGKFQKENGLGLNLKETITLNDLFEVSQGLIPYDKYRGHSQEQIKNRVYHSDKKLGTCCKKELRGKDVSPFKVSWSGNNWIKYGPWLAAPRDKKFFTRPRVLVREITSSKNGQINCAFTKDEFYNTPSIINIVCNHKNAEKYLKTLAVLLSSSYYGEYHLKNNPKAKKGLFPKILVNDIRNLPLPKNFEALDFSVIYNKAAMMVKNGKDYSAVQSFIDLSIENLFIFNKAA